MMITPSPLVYTDGSRKIGILLTLDRSKLGLKKGNKLVNKNILQIFIGMTGEKRTETRMRCYNTRCIPYISLHPSLHALCMTVGRVVE